MSRYQTHQVIFALLLIWMTFLSVFALLQLSGFPIGFNVWPMGEDQAWLGFMFDAHGKKMVHEFWNQDGRNPLSAWWWLAASPLIKNTTWGLYAVRKCVDPFLAIITFLLLDRLGREQCRTFAFCVAMMVLVWNFSPYYEQIQWDFLVALGLNLTSIFFYCRFLDSHRRTSHDLAIALICYLVTIATYTLQAGTLIAIAALAFFRHAQGLPLTSRLRNTFVDTSLFFAFFFIYVIIWYTVNGHAGAFSHPTWQSVTSQFMLSSKELFFHSFYLALWQYILMDWSHRTIAMISIASFLFFCILFFIFPAKRFLNTSLKFPLGWVIVLMLAIAVPTIALESFSSTWPPGTRSVMIEQVWQPLLYVTLLFLIANLLPKKMKRVTQTMVLLMVALLGAFAVLAGFNYNYRLVIRTQYQQILAKGLDTLFDEKRPITYFLVKMTDPNNQDLNTIPQNVIRYGQTMLNRKRAVLRVFTNQPYPNAQLAPFWKVKLGSDKEGVLNAAPIDFRDIRDKKNPQTIPYENIRIVFFDGKTVWLPAYVNKEDVEGLQVEWQRQKPIHQIKENAS